MAKITARGAHQVAAVNATSGAHSTRWVLRSDRVILRRWRGSSGTGYSRFGKIKPTAELSEATLRRIVTATGWTPEATR